MAGQGPGSQVQQAAQRRVAHCPPRPGRVVRVGPGGVTDGTGDEPQESFDVHFRKIRSYKGKRGKTYTVRWDVAGVTHPETFKTLALAQSRLAELRTYARNGV